MSETKKNILVTGGCGFMGSNFIRRIFRKYPNYRIFNLDALTYAGNLDNLADIEQEERDIDHDSKRYRFIKGDICDSALVDNVFGKYHFSLVVNFAAETHVDRSIFNVADFIRTNVEGTRIILEMVRKYNIPRFVHISTDEVYGSVLEGWADENAPFRPSNPYAASKAGADLLVQAYMQTYKIPAVIIRGSNNFGPFQYPEKLIPLGITNMISGQKIPIHGSGEHIRSWLHVEDFCAAVDLAAHKAEDHKIYNVSGEHKSNLGVLSVLAGHLNVDLNALKEHVNDRPAADLRYAPDCSRLERELGWARQHSLASSAGDIVGWYLDNKEWWQKIKIKQEYLAHYTKQAKAQWY